MKIRFFLLSSALLPFPALADNASLTPEVVVSATRFAIPKEQVGSSVSIISRADIEKSGASQVFDVLKQTPGLSFTRTGGVGTISNIRLRGANTGQVRVMIDGVNVNDPSEINNDYVFHSLPASDVERIEIIRGPQSALYGSSAMGGVINIITKKGAGPARFTGGLEVGSYETFRQNAGVSGSTERVEYRLSVDNFDTGGFSRVTTGPEKDATHDKNAAAALGIQLTSNIKLDMSGRIGELTAGFDPSSTLDGPATLDKRSRSGKASLTAQTLSGAWEHIVSAQGANTVRKFDQPLGFNRYESYDGTQNTFEYQSNLKLRARDVLTGGLATERQATENTSTNAGITSLDIDRAFRTNSVYSQYLLGLGDATTLTLGGRHDDHSTFGGANTYRATATHRIEQTGTTLRASYGTGFKAPTLFQLYYAFGGNANLKPEKSTGYDVGVEQALLSNRGSLSVTLFHNEFKNLIDYTTAYVNVDRATTKGVETSARFDITPQLSASAGHTYVWSEDERTNRILPRRPKNTITTGLDYTMLGAFNVGGDLRYVSRQLDSNFSTAYTKAYTTLDLRGSYDITPQVAAYARLENLLNRDYQEVRRYNAPGRSIYVGVRGSY